MRNAVTRATLRHQNRAFAGTAGVSAGSGPAYVPAFRDGDSGHIAVARYADGRPAPMHLLDGLPAEWAVARDGRGRITAVKGSVVGGFLRNGVFFTRDEVARGQALG
jgi:hypothetical protein